MTEAQELPDDYGTRGWWSRVFHRQREEQARQAEELERAERLADAFGSPFDPDAWREQRAELGMPGKVSNRANGMASLGD